jgi:hypothetical protein
LDADGTLTDGGHEDFRLKDFGNSSTESEAVEAGFSEKDSIVFTAFDFAQARVHVAAEFADVEIGACVTNLRLTAEAAGAEARALAQGCESLSGLCHHETIAHIVAAADHGKTETRRDVGRNILDAMNRKVDFFAEERVFQLFDENTLSADFGKAGLLEFVAGGLDDYDFRVDSGGLEDLFADKFRLPAGQDASARSDSRRLHGFSRSFRNKSRKASTF